MARLDSTAASLAGARQLARAILLSRPELGTTLDALLTADAAWVLSLLLWSWRPTGTAPIDVSAYGDVTMQFDHYAATLLRLRDVAGSARTDLDLAGASGLFISAAKQIGTTLLAYVLKSGRFAQIQRDVLSQAPAPPGLLAAAAPRVSAPEPSRVRRFDGFDRRLVRADSTSNVDASPVEVAQWQAQLRRADLEPAMRWLYEQKLLAANQAGYGTASEARQRWQDARAKAETEQIRAYFARNLRELERA